MPPSTRRTSRILENKVPEITAVFWVIKILATTVGETGADYLAVNAGLGTGLTTGLTCAVLLALLCIQVAMPRYVPAIYWLTVVFVSVVGTQLTDVLTDRMEVSLYYSTAAFAFLLLVAFAVWYAVERTLSIHAVDTTRRELFYWLVVLLTFALGTAAGDLATEALGLGFTLGVLVFSGAIAFIGLLYFANMNGVLAFWLAYVLTRPLGASLGDLLSQSQIYGGLGLGAVNTSLIFLTIILMLVVYLTLARAGRTQRPA
ncbi:hypothetical protein [Azorhizobium doebereinerae]|uniref:COG4705 family protein n=1 Tax=Azorhizobium doebereinerae TaxID=281091 RepID=UPI000409E2FC|nr:hypothetical protein [Azorhizobium doebereinerae]